MSLRVSKNIKKLCIIVIELCNNEKIKKNSDEVNMNVLHNYFENENHMKDHNNKVSKYKIKEQ